MDIVYITGLTIFAADIGTVTGFGTSTIMVPILLGTFLLLTGLKFLVFPS